MNKQDEPYVQCDLSHIDGKRDTAWIPERFAKKNHAIKLKVDGAWEQGWVVTATYTKKMFAEIEEKERDYLYQREASDI